MSSKDSKSASKPPVSKKPEVKKPEVKKSAKSLTFQGREVEIISTRVSMKGQDRDLLEVKFLDDGSVSRIRRKSLD